MKTIYYNIVLFFVMLSAKIDAYFNYKSAIRLKEIMQICSGQDAELAFARRCKEIRSYYNILTKKDYSFKQFEDDRKYIKEFTKTSLQSLLLFIFILLLVVIILA